MRQHGQTYPPVRTWTLAALAATVLAASAASAIPSDTCAAANVMAALPYADNGSTAGATVDPADPVPSCGAGDHSVWYTYTAPGAAPTTLEIDTAGSAYDTVISVYTGAGCLTLSEIACNEETPAGGLAKMIIPVAGGDTIYIQVSSDTPGAGNLTFAGDVAATKWSPQPNLEVIAASHELNPFGSGYGVLHGPTAMKATRFIFPATDHGIFINNVGGLTEIAKSGDPSPTGAAFNHFSEPVTNANGDVAFYAALDGGFGVDEGFFLYTAATGLITSLVLEGDVGPGGGTFRNFQRGQIALNDSGEVAFVGRETTNGSDNGLYFLSGGIISLLALEGDPSACGGVYQDFTRSRPQNFALNNNGVVALHDSGNGANPDGIYKLIVGGATAVACEGIATPSGGVFSSFGARPDINNLDDIAFLFEDSIAGSVLAVVAGAGGISTVVKQDDVLPTGEVVCAMDTRRGVPAINDNQDVAVTIEVDTGGIAPCVAINDEIVALRQAPALLPSAIANLASPCVGGVPIADYHSQVNINAAAEVALEAQCDNSHGTFLIAPTGAVSLAFQITDATSVGTGFLARYPDTAVAGESVTLGKRTAIYGRKCNAGGCGPVTTIVQPLDVEPGGKTIQEIHPETVNATTSRMIFVAKTFGNISESILAAKKSGSLTLIAESGTPLPGGIGTFDTFLSDSIGNPARPSIDGRHILFSAIIDHPTNFAGLFRHVRGVGTSILALDGDVMPSGNTLDDFHAPHASAKFGVLLGETSVGSCMVRIAKTGDLIEEACPGDPTPVGGTYDDLELSPSLRRKSMFFVNSISGAASNECLFQHGPPGTQALICDTEPLPGGDEVDTLVLNTQLGPAATVRGKGVAFLADGTGLSTETALIAERRSVFTLVSKIGDTAPVPASGLINLGGRFSKNKKSVVFLSYQTGGSARAAIFLGRL